MHWSNAVAHTGFTGLKAMMMQASHCKKIFSGTPKIFKFKDVLRTGSRQHTTTGCNTLQKKQKNVPRYISLTRSTDRAPKGRQGRQSLGQNSNEFNFFACKYTALLVFRSFTQFLRNLRANFGFLRTFEDINTSLWRLKCLVTLSTYRRYINQCIYLSIYLSKFFKGIKGI